MAVSARIRAISRSGRGGELAVALAVAHQGAVDQNPAVLIGLQEIDAAQEGGLAGAARPDDADDFAGA